MLRGPKTPLKVKENESGCPDQKEKASREQKSCKVTKSKVIRPSKKENFTDGNQPQPPKRALKCPKSPKQNLGPPQGGGGSCFGVLREDVLSEPPLHTKKDFSSSPAAPLGNDFTAPERDKVEGKADFGLSEQRNKADFAAVISAELGIPQESFGKRPTGASPKSLKFRRRSTIGLRGSPENNSLIRYLAQQRSSRQREAFTQISPFPPANVRSLKDKIDAFQASFESLQESEGEPGLSHLGKGGSSQDKAPFKKEPNLEQWNEKFMLGNRGAAWKENFNKNGSKKSRSELRICSILSPVTVTDPAAAKEWVYEQPNPIKSLETVLTGDILEKGHGPRCEHGDAASDPSTRKAEGVGGESLAMLGGSQGPVTPLGTRNIASSDLCHSSSLLRSILKKTPGRELRDSPKEYSKSAIDRGGDESAAISNCVKTFETLQIEPTDTQSSKTPKKKKVTFGEVLSPEIFDQSLPANTPLRRGASPRQSPWARLGLSEQPLPVLDLGWDEEGVEPLPEFLEGSAAAVENAEVAETDKPDMITPSPTKRKFSDAEGDFDTSEHFQQGKDTPCEKESSSLLEKDELQGHLTGLEVLDQQEGAQRAKDSVRADPARRRRSSSSAFCFPPAEDLETPGADAALCCFRLEEALAGPLQGSSSSTELRVRRSMRLSRGASEGLAWIQLPPEPPKQPPKSRRSSSSSTSILAGAENIHHREQTLLPLPAPGKENESSAPLTARRGRRRSLCEATAPETHWAPTQRRRSTNSVCGKDRSNQKHSEAAETLELRLRDVSGISDFLK
ncbi:PREDICTED: cell division cycle-associated protein 2 [Ficedula albicollis]|uniref:cell division cycle-associated protein 2 n=1 Tax=Ficedula albicollis TaxID=59894 RepID=UPI0007AD8057|nr:PREDICTED: cell division cycle-associated protein 2 [Ficedula albicollis]